MVDLLERVFTKGSIMMVKLYSVNTIMTGGTVVTVFILAMHTILLIGVVWKALISIGLGEVLFMSKEYQVTKWHTGTVSPSRVGMYQRKYGTQILWARWDGKDWYCSEVIQDYQSFHNAERHTQKTLFGPLPWRGVIYV